MDKNRFNSVENIDYLLCNALTTEINEDVQMYTNRKLSWIIILVNKLTACIPGAGQREVC